MKIIDAHMHFSDHEGFEKTARDISQVKYSIEALYDEFNRSEIVAGIIMTTPGSCIYQPPIIDQVARETPQLFSCVGVNPQKLNEKDEIYRVEKELDSGFTVGIKLYPGYFPYYVYDSIYDPIYELARKYQVPVAVHCGDTQSPKGILKYAHPLTIDELAVRYEEINFIICHLGIPWVMDAAEVISKNPNVYGDVSGLIGGNYKQVVEMKEKRLYTELIQQGLEFANAYDKILFGSDWPLVPIEPYIEFIKHIIPAKHHENVFYHNAITVYSKLKKDKSK